MAIGKKYTSDNFIDETKSLALLEEDLKRAVKNRESYYNYISSIINLNAQTVSGQIRGTGNIVSEPIHRKFCDIIILSKVNENIKTYEDYLDIYLRPNIKSKYIKSHGIDVSLIK